MRNSRDRATLHTISLEKSTQPSASAKHLPQKLICSYALLLSYIAGILSSPLFLKQEQHYLFLFFQTYLEELSIRRDTAQLLSYHIYAFLSIWAALIFLQYSALGTPLILFLVFCKGVISTAAFTCIITSLTELTLRDYLLSNTLFEFGYIFALWPFTLDTLAHSITLFQAFFLKKRLPEVRSSAIERPLGALICLFLWCLFALAINHLFSLN